MGYGEEKSGQLTICFIVARSPLVTKSDAQQLIHAGIDLLQKLDLKELPTLLLFLYLWNLGALWYERGPKPPNPFAKLFNSDISQRLITDLDRRVSKAKQNEERLFILELAGLLGYLQPERRGDLMSLLWGCIRRLQYLREDALQQSFVLAFFALAGISLLSPTHVNFTPENCQHLLTAVAEYEERGPTIDFLCEQIELLSKR